MKKARLDLLVVERGLFPTRQAAQTAIMDGVILVDGQKVTKPGLNVGVDAAVELVPGYSAQKFVSRGGLKLERALEVFSVDARDRVCIDVGASTGGFTDCLLKHGARCVYAVDVGYGQLDWSLRKDERVRVKERVNARYLTRETLYGDDAALANLLVADVSFISLTKLLPACRSLLSDEGAEMILLIKPQFEAGKHAVGKGGVVKSQATHKEVIETVMTASRALGLYPTALTYSPIKGPAGNIEYLIHLQSGVTQSDIDVAGIVAEADYALSSHSAEPG